MDPSISWLQREQEGPARDIWLRLWHTQQEFDSMNITNGDNDIETLNTLNNHNQTNGGVINGKTNNCDIKSSFLATRRRSKDVNRASTRGMNRHPEKLMGEYGGYPWRRKGHPYKRGILGLHEEIEHFYDWMKPTKIEHNLRDDVIRRIENIILKLWPDAQVQVFGSYQTGLYLPTSDIDIVVIGRWTDLPLRTLEKEFLAQDIADASTIKVLDKASVPIVKLTDKMSEIKVDISFNMCNGLKSAELIKSYKQKYPALTKLVYVLKQFLLERDLNEVFTGGISSYSLILMCISFLQLHPRFNPYQTEYNLGVLLIDFFELYGRKFNYMRTGIRVKDGGQYINKEEMQKEMIDGHRPSLLCIEDPLQPNNDIGRSSYGVLQVKRAFDWAYTQLSIAVSPTYSYPAVPPFPILSRVVLITDDVVRYRNWVRQSFSSMYNISPAVSPSLQCSAINPTSRPTRSLSSSGSTSSVDSNISSEGSDTAPSRDISPNTMISSQKQIQQKMQWMGGNKNSRKIFSKPQQYQQNSTPQNKKKKTGKTFTATSRA